MVDAVRRRRDPWAVRLGDHEPARDGRGTRLTSQGSEEDFQGSSDTDGGWIYASRTNLAVDTVARPYGIGPN